MSGQPSQGTTPNSVSCWERVLKLCFQKREITKVWVWGLSELSDRSQPKPANKLDVQQRINGKTNRGVSVKWNTTQEKRRKEQQIHTTTWLCNSQNYYAKWKKPNKRSNTIWFTEHSRKCKLTHSDSKQARGCLRVGVGIVLRRVITFEKRSWHNGRTRNQVAEGWKAPGKKAEPVSLGNFAQKLTMKGHKKDTVALVSYFRNLPSPGSCLWFQLVWPKQPAPPPIPSGIWWFCSQSGIHSPLHHSASFFQTKCPCLIAAVQTKLSQFGTPMIFITCISSYDIFNSILPKLKGTTMLKHIHTGLRLSEFESQLSHIVAVWP